MLADRGAEANDVDIAVLPRLEAPAPSTQVNERPPSQVAERISATNGFSRSTRAARHKETRAPRTAQKLAAGTGEHVAADDRDIDRELADGLGGVKQVEHIGGPGETAHNGCRRIHQAARGGYPGHADQLGPRVDQVRERGDVDLAGVVVRDDHDFRTGPPSQLQVGQHVAAVFVAPGQDPVTGAKRHGVERGVPCVGGVVEKCDLSWERTESSASDS